MLSQDKGRYTASLNQPN